MQEWNARYLFHQFNISRKEFFEILILVFNALTWYYMTLTILSNISNNLGFTQTEFLITSSTYHIAIICSGGFGSILSNRIRKIPLLYSWILLGTILPFGLAFFDITMVNHAVGAFFIMGIIIGFGLPSCLTYLADYATIENRGRVSGLISLITFLSFIPIIIIFGTLDLKISIIISAAWRAIGFFLFWLLKPKEKTVAFEKERRKSLVSILHDRSFLLYWVPWLLFWLVDRSEESLLRTFLKNIFDPHTYNLLQLAYLLLWAVFALFGGIMSDLIGRKRVIISGFIALGLGYAVIGLAPESVFSWYLYTIVDGIAWGIFLAAFILIVWGDLSRSGVKEKYYWLGNIPFFLTSVIQLFLAPLIALATPSSAFSLAAFFLFLAVLPLMYAPETLPEKKIELRRLKSYVEQAKKLREKSTKKSGDKS